MHAVVKLGMNLVRTQNLLSAFVMKYYLLLVVAAVCEGARIPRITESYFPGFQGAYHGQGVPGFHGQPDNYAPVQFPGGYRTPYGNLDVGNEYHSRQTPLGDHANAADDFAGVPFNVASNHGGFNPQPALPQNYGRFNHVRDYDYQI